MIIFGREVFSFVFRTNMPGGVHHSPPSGQTRGDNEVMESIDHTPVNNVRRGSKKRLKLETTDDFVCDIGDVVLELLEMKIFVVVYC